MINDKLGGFSPLSMRLEFKDAFFTDLKENSQETRLAASMLKSKFPNRDDRLHEIWADLFAHASDAAFGVESTNDYANMIKNGFPKCLEELTKIRGSM